tara:strand:+ start:185 stop:670 length:486 start_codon:yes stop_codon:yes gene_type:complete
MARTTFSGPLASANGSIHNGRVSIGATGTISAAALATTGYITCTSVAATTITLPIAVTAGAVQGLVPALNASAGQKFTFIVDNTAGASAVTIAVGTGGTLSDAANTTAASFGDVTLASGVRGMAQFTLMFTGGLTAPTAANPQPNQALPGTATGYTLTRTA